MRSLADRLRLGAEFALRVVALGTIAWCLADALRDHRDAGAEDVAPAGLPAALVRWSTVAAPASVRVRLTEPPAAVERDWLAAVAGAGTMVAWGGAAATPSALVVERVADPAGGVQALVAAPPASRVTLGDEIGALDSTTAGGRLRRFHVGATPQTLTARIAGVTAVAASPESLTLRRVVVLGRGGWEAKFVTSALEERGWVVDAHLAISPKSDVLQGAVATLDTARHAAVVVLDTSATRYAARIRRFAADGGGVVMWAGAARDPALGALVPARPGPIQPGSDIQPTDSAPRLRLPLAPLRAVHPEAVVLETRAGDTTIVARRSGLGRALLVGYDETWRWRMRGGDDAPEQHRAWVSGLVASVAFTGAARDASASPDAAPLVALVHRLGAPAALPDGVDGGGQGSRLPGAWTIFSVLCAAFLLEWVSRRLRGAR